MSKEKKKSSCGKFLLGLGLGAGLGLLFAPKKGSELRKDLKNKLDELLEKAKNIDVQEVKENFQKKVQETKTEVLIIGLPKNMDGTLGESAIRAQSISSNLKNRLNIPIILWDERMTTVSAHMILSQANVRGKKRKNAIDSLSASIILENYLQFRKFTKSH